MNLLLQQINKDFSLRLDGDETKIHAQLSAYINDMILHNFEGLINLLYRIDISEQKVKAMLQSADGKPAGDIIAQLIIERELQKIEWRKKFGTSNDISEEERW